MPSYDLKLYFNDGYVNRGYRLPHFFDGGLFPLPPPDGLPVLLGQFGLPPFPPLLPFPLPLAMLSPPFNIQWIHCLSSFAKSKIAIK